MQYMMMIVQIYIDFECNVTLGNLMLLLDILYFNYCQ